ncbi:MAG: IS66 family transposase zinc-finger binding domain-containing protein [Planctomycetaceae bacterium]
MHELPEEQRLCPIDGKPMPAIRYEISEQLDYEPAKLKRIQHKRAVYACAAKHDEATLITVRNCGGGRETSGGSGTAGRSRRWQIW